MQSTLSQVLLVATLIMCGCGGNSSEPPKPDVLRTSVTSPSGYEVTYTPQPDPIPLNDHFSIEVTVVAPDRSVDLKDLSINVDAGMPSHGHGINTAPNVQASGDGRFKIDGLLFHMPGEWELYVDVILGPVRERATFPLTMN